MSCAPLKREKFNSQSEAAVWRSPAGDATTAISSYDLVSFRNSFLNLPS